MRRVLLLLALVALPAYSLDDGAWDADAWDDDAWADGSWFESTAGTPANPGEGDGSNRMGIKGARIGL